MRGHVRDASAAKCLRIPRRDCPVGYGASDTTMTRKRQRTAGTALEDPCGGVRWSTDVQVGITIGKMERYPQI